MKKILLGLLLANIFLFVTGCQKNETVTESIYEQVQEKPEESDNQEEGPTLQKERLPLTIGLMPDMGAIPFVVAKEEGYFEAAGLDVELVVFRSAMDRDAALVTGNLDGAMADMLAILFFNQGGLPIKMTSATYGDYKMVTAPGLNEEDFSLLEDKMIGLSSATVIDFATAKIADAGSFSEDLVKVAIPQMPVRLEMLSKGELSGATLPDPLAATAVEAGGAVVGTTSSMDLYPGIFLMNEAILQSENDNLSAFYAAYDRAVMTVNDQGIGAYYDHLVALLGFPEAMKDQINVPTFNLSAAPDEHTFIETQKWMLGEGLLEEETAYETLYVEIQ